MASNPTVSELLKAAEISDDEIDTAVDSYMASQNAKLYPLSDGYVIAIADAIERYAPARRALADFELPFRFRRNRVRAAILLAHPVKG